MTVDSIAFRLHWRLSIARVVACARDDDDAAMMVAVALVADICCIAVLLIMAALIVDAMWLMVLVTQLMKIRYDGGDGDVVDGGDGDDGDRGGCEYKWCRQ